MGTFSNFAVCNLKFQRKEAKNQTKKYSFVNFDRSETSNAQYLISGGPSLQ